MNLNADMLDGVSASAFALGQNVTILANRIVMGNGDPNATLLTLPGLGVLTAYCQNGSAYAGMFYDNSTADSIDVWYYEGASMIAYIAPPTSVRSVASWNGATQDGTTLNLGQGNSPGARRTASVTVSAYRSAAGAPCALQATATLWTTP